MAKIVDTNLAIQKWSYEVFTQQSVAFSAK